MRRYTARDSQVLPTSCRSHVEGAARPTGLTEWEGTSQDLSNVGFGCDAPRWSRVLLNPGCTMICDLSASTRRRSMHNADCEMGGV